VARAASLMGFLATDAPASTLDAVSSATSTALGEGGAGSHLSGRAHPPSLSFSSSSSDGEYSEVAAEKSPCCSRRRNSSLFCPRCSRHRILFSFLRVARSCSRCCAARAQVRGVGGSDRAAFTVTICRGRAKDQASPARRE
jgi:hypothetical protein